MQKPRFDIVLPFWGERYRNVLINASLPLQLAKGNLIGFPWLEDSRYVFYTSKKDAEILKKHKLFAQLESIIKTEFVYIDDFMLSDDYKSKWSLLRYCHKTIANAGDARDAAVFYIQPDMLLAPNSLTNAANYIVYNNKTAVFTTGVRANEEKILSELSHNYKTNDNINISNRQLIELLCNNPHPETLTWHWEDPNYLKIPTYMLFDIENEGILAFAYILHPFLIKSEKKFVEFGKIIDQSYILAACPDVTKHYIPQDSDEIAFIEVSPEHMEIPGIPPEIQDLEPIPSMAYRGETDYNYIHRQMVNYPLRLHYNEITEAKWQHYEQIGKKIIKQTQDLWNMSNMQLLRAEPIVLGQRLFKKMNDSNSTFFKLYYKYLRYSVILYANINNKNFYQTLLVKIYCSLNKYSITRNLMAPLVKLRKAIIGRQRKVT